MVSDVANERKAFFEWEIRKTKREIEAYERENGGEFMRPNGLDDPLFTEESLITRDEVTTRILECIFSVAQGINMTKKYLKKNGGTSK
jgi:hypothetical protein